MGMDTSSSRLCPLGLLAPSSFQDFCVPSPLHHFPLLPIPARAGHTKQASVPLRPAVPSAWGCPSPPHFTCAIRLQSLLTGNLPSLPAASHLLGWVLQPRLLMPTSITASVTTLFEHSQGWAYPLIPKDQIPKAQARYITMVVESHWIYGNLVPEGSLDITEATLSPLCWDTLPRSTKEVTKDPVRVTDWGPHFLGKASTPWCKEGQASGGPEAAGPSLPMQPPGLGCVSPVLSPQALYCSCFVPVYCGLIPPTYRGVVRASVWEGA